MIGRHGAGRLTVLAVLALAGGCAGSGVARYVSGKDLQDRHSMSRLYPATDGATLIFEASVSAEYPPDDPAAEAARERWIAQWLARRSLCPDGYEILDRAHLGAAADNPYGHHLRYRLRCSPGG